MPRNDRIDMRGNAGPKEVQRCSAIHSSAGKIAMFAITILSLISTELTNNLQFITKVKQTYILPNHVGNS